MPRGICNNPVHNAPQNFLAMTDQQINRLERLCLDKRQRMAGGFEYALIEAFRKADGNNQAILIKAFKGTQFEFEE